MSGTHHVESRGARRGDLHRGGKELAGDLGQLLGRHSNRACHLHVRGHFGTDRDVQIRPGEPDATVGSLDENVCQDGQGRLGRDARCDRGQAFLQLLTRDRKAHSHSGRLVLGQLRGSLSNQAVHPMAGTHGCLGCELSTHPGLPSSTLLEMDRVVVVVEACGSVQNGGKL
jgi:hypothetical protein